MSRGLPVDSKPVLAVLTTADPHKMFAGNRANFRDILNVGREMGFLSYVVTTRDLRLSEERVMGFTYSPDLKQWQQDIFPLPNVIYNRIPLREDERRPSVRRKIEECLSHPAIHLYNPSFFNKWQLFGWLKDSHITRPFVPETKRLRGRKSLMIMMDQFHSLYLKPESGKAGKGIMRLRFNYKDIRPYKLTISSPGKNQVYKTAMLSRLWKRLYRETEGTDYIVQQGIELCKYRGRHFDLRVLVQKTGKGQWAVTGIGARLAGPLRITTHVPQGGSVEDPEKMLLPTFGLEETTFLLSRVKANAIMIAKQIERASGKTHGEMSMDLGVDSSGKLWFFEANAKPMKFDEPHIRKKSLERIFQFSQYLAKQSK
ncbi:endospore coat-associated protein [Paenibacillus sp. CAA11]|uniref:YheC/YheD family endospore coat-associated protein n=1 Tax=Paenibacillus sp. CAA11 TaxID=1532905 RepID=UPI000D3554AC|nr:YheC/YheD family protein [Paenibacillus sp. CAA11]AWB44048.1 endospore coat-associated protein [Paenibacillus sp. CAA11]